MTATNARFWVFANNGFVKITLRPDQSLTWGWSARHEEGWSSEVVTWTHTGTAVERERSCDGRDCDGRTSEDQITACALDALATWDTTLPDAPGLVPTWDDVRTSRYDEYAEGMNY
jgi:hypothetical protein